VHGSAVQLSGFTDSPDETGKDSTNMSKKAGVLMELACNGRHQAGPDNCHGELLLGLIARDQLLRHMLAQRIGVGKVPALDQCGCA